MGGGVQCDQPTDKCQRELLASYHQTYCVPDRRNLCRVVYAEPETEPETEPKTEPKKEKKGEAPNRGPVEIRKVDTRASNINIDKYCQQG